MFRILHSAAKYHSERKLTGKEEETYRKAYQDLNNHKAYMDYQEYRHRSSLQNRVIPSNGVTAPNESKGELTPATRRDLIW